MELGNHSLVTRLPTVLAYVTETAVVAANELVGRLDLIYNELRKKRRRRGQKEGRRKRTKMSRCICAADRK